MTDSTDDMESHEWEADEYISSIGERESSWESGYHKTSDERKIRLSNMTISHLKNTINYFQYDHDVSTLEKELKSRTIKK